MSEAVKKTIVMRIFSPDEYCRLHAPQLHCHKKLELLTECCLILENDKNAMSGNSWKKKLKIDVQQAFDDARHNCAERGVSLQSKPPITSELNFKFLELLLDMQDRRRDAIDIRASVVLSVAVVILGFVLDKGSELLKDAPLRMTHPLFLGVVVLLLFMSILFSLRLVAPIRRPRPQWKARVAIWTWFWAIGAEKKEEWVLGVTALHDDVMRTELAGTIHDISVLLRRRYNDLHSSFVFLILALGLFLLGILAGYSATVLKSSQDEKPKLNTAIHSNSIPGNGGGSKQPSIPNKPAAR